MQLHGRNFYFLFAKMGSFIVACLLMCQLPALAQTPVNITIIDNELKQPVPFASILFTNAEHQFSAITDDNGQATLKVALGTYKVIVQHLSFQTYTREGVVIGEGFGNLNIKLTPAASQLDDVVITARKDDQNVDNPFSTVSAHHVTVEQLETQPASFKDVARLVTNYAGVNGGGGDERNEIVVRGNSSRGVAWYIEELPVPSPNHFSSEGGSGGAVNMVSANNLASAELFTGAFPAIYNNALSGVFDLRTRAGSMTDHKYGFEVSVLGVDARAEGYFKKDKSSYNLNYRYSTLSLIEKVGIDIKGLIAPFYHDLNYKLQFNVSPQTQVAVFGVNGFSSYDKEYHSEINGEEVLIKKKTESYSMCMNGFSVTHHFNENLTYKSIHAYVATYYYVNDDRLNDSLTAFYNAVDTKHSYQYIKSHDYLLYHKGRFTLQTGLVSNVYQYNLHLEDDTEPDLISNTPIDTTALFVGSKNFTFDAQYYVSAKVNIGTKTLVTGGINTMYHALTNNWSSDPRLGVKYFINNKHTLAYAFGVHTHYEATSVYLVKLNDYVDPVYQPNDHLGPSHAFHHVLSYGYRPSDYTTIGVETYFQYLYQVPVGTGDESYFSTLTKTDGITRSKLANNGIGRNYGIEVSVEQFLPRRILISANGTVYDAKYRANDGQLHDSPYNGRFAFKLMSGKEFLFGENDKHKLTVGGKLSLSGGSRYTPLDVDASAVYGKPVKDKNRLFSNQTPMNYRIDLGIHYQLTAAKYTMKLKLDIQNVTNRETIDNIDYDPVHGLVYDKQGQILPVLFIQFGF